jgi:hypothetical protein
MDGGPANKERFVEWGKYPEICWILCEIAQFAGLSDNYITWPRFLKPVKRFKSRLNVSLSWKVVKKHEQQ